MTAQDLFALAFGLFLGLALVKFGNPVILDSKISPPGSFSEFWAYPWPPHWSVWLLAPFALAGGWLCITKPRRWPGSRWFWILPIVWFTWQLVAATSSVDTQLTTITLWHFGGCLTCYFLGAFVIGARGGLRFLMVGVLVAFTFCLVRAVAQKCFEFPQEYQALVEGGRSGWTNFSPEVVVQMKQDGQIIRTNGIDAANPVFLEKYAKGRVMGTLVYPNALAGVVLLLWPVSLVLAFRGTRRFRPATRIGVIALALFLGGAGIFWSGSKFGWLVAVALAGISLLRLDCPAGWKWLGLVLIVVGGATVFAARFHRYFATGAASVGARLDYWQVAVEVTREHPLLGCGPGTFQRPYARLKAPSAEMTRLVHNDYLEQYCDSGVVGGTSYAAWIVLTLLAEFRRLLRAQDFFLFAVFLGLSGWFVQGLAEFSLYIPALAWTAFSILGCLLAALAKPFDKPQAQH